VLIEHVNHLAARGHDVALVAPRPGTPRWIKVDVPIVPISVFLGARPLDAVVATGYQTVGWALQIPAQRRYYFVQMMEHRFFGQDSSGWRAARNSYQLAALQNFQVITIADWLKRALYEKWGIDASVVPNGVNQKQFYPDRLDGRKHAVLVEGDARNPAKDTDHVSWRVALELRKRYGVELWGYSAISHPFVGEMDRHVLVPSTQDMRHMYSRCLFLLKASKYEGRACAPVEAMACGTTSARAIIEGDDDLVDRRTCLRTPYDYDELLEAACLLMDRSDLRRHLERNCLEYAKAHLQWDMVVDQLEQHLGVA